MASQRILIELAIRGLRAQVCDVDDILQCSPRVGQERDFVAFLVAEAYSAGESLAQMCSNPYRVTFESEHAVSEMIWRLARSQTHLKYWMSACVWDARPLVATGQLGPEEAEWGRLAPGTNVVTFLREYNEGQPLPISRRTVGPGWPSFHFFAVEAGGPTDRLFSAVRAAQPAFADAVRWFSQQCAHRPLSVADSHFEVFPLGYDHQREQVAICLSEHLSEHAARGFVRSTFPHPLVVLPLSRDEFERWEQGELESVRPHMPDGSGAAWP
jgi:hypothetical protein